VKKLLLRCLFQEKRDDGYWIKNIVFDFLVPVDSKEVKELPLETETTVESVVLLSQLK
jgi:site-specific DNA recombinase